MENCELGFNVVVFTVLEHNTQTNEICVSWNYLFLFNVKVYEIF